MCMHVYACMHVNVLVHVHTWLPCPSAHVNVCMHACLMNTRTVMNTSCSLYTQVRAVNLGNLEGNWSNAEVLDIADIPPPAAITIQTPVLELATDSNGDQFFSVTVGVEWEGPASTDTMQRKKREPVRETEMEISSYMVAIGVEEIEPFGEVPETTSVETSSVSKDTLGTHCYTYKIHLYSLLHV